jgi:hypothetical protein
VQYRERLAYLSTAQHGNVTIYARSAQHRPFIGCGELVTNLSVAVPLIPIADEDAARRRSEAPLNPAALYRRMRQALVTLDDPQVPPDERLEGLSLQNRIFVHGLLRPGHPLIDEAKQPRSRITADELQALAADERNRATHYLTARISGWQGELDVTVFMYFSIRGRMLYFEFLGASLQPINSVYHAIDTFPQITGAVTLRAVLSALLETPHVLATAPVNLARPLIDSLRRQLDLRTQLQRIATRVAFDFGADGSVRELGDIVAVPPVREARDNGLLAATAMDVEALSDADVVVWCTGFRPALSHLAPLRLRDGKGRVAVDGTTAAEEPRLHLLGYGGWTGPASATLIGVGPTAKATVAKIAATIRP